MKRGIGKDYTGQKCGKLTLIKPTDQKKYSSIVWECKCECGNICFFPASYVSIGRIKSCGCSMKGPRKPKIDMSGEIFGRLTFIRPTEKRGGRNSVIWELLCECGKSTYGTANAVLNYKKISCGCYTGPSPNPVDYTNKKFHKLTFVECTGETNNKGCYLWKALCECGKYTEVIPSIVISGNTKSCGCLIDECNKNKRKYDPLIKSAMNVWKKYYSDGDIDFDTFFILSQKNCNWCGTPPSSLYNAYKNLKQTAIEEANFYYNCLDRLDNSIRHMLNNVVTCCRTCNLMRRNSTVEDFLGKVKEIYEHTHNNLLKTK